MYLGYKTGASFSGYIWQFEIMSGTEISIENQFSALNFCRIDGYWANYYQCYLLCPNEGESLIDGVCSNNSELSYDATFDFSADNNGEKIASSNSGFAFYKGIDALTQFDSEIVDTADETGMTFGTNNVLTFGIENSYTF